MEVVVVILGVYRDRRNTNFRYNLRNWFFLNMFLCFWYCICHFYCLFSVLSFTELFIDHSIKDFVLFRRSKARQKRSNHKYFGASKTNRVCWGFFFNFLTLTVGDRQKYFKIMQFKKIYKTETRNVVYLVILQILVLDLLNNFIDNEHKVSRKYVNLFRTIDLFNV